MNKPFKYTKGLVNRVEMPEKRILVVEDDLECQRLIAEHMTRLFLRQGKVTVSFVADALQAAVLLMSVKFDLILLDHDLQIGNGVELLIYMQECGVITPVMTFSGHPVNNERMMAVGATYHSEKFDVINGKHNSFILEAVK
jgi:DNA-binding response OmpR family regulator